MSNGHALTNPWLVAVWPGMGNVALSAGYYLMAKLGMSVIGEYSPEELFDVDYVDVKDGLIRAAERPRSRLFAWKDPHGKNDVVVFIGEAQPRSGKYAFCRHLISKAQELGVEHVFTFAAMATEMRPEHHSRVFGAATDGESLRELQQLNLEMLTDGQISGLNGVLLGAAAEAGIRGTCLLGEIPHVFAQIPFPKASLAVLQIFARVASLEVNLEELSDQARIMEERLTQLLTQVEHVIQGDSSADDEFGHTAAEEKQVDPEQQQRIEALFEAAGQDRSRAYELKQLLDEQGVFKDYEDRFLDLFRQREG